MCTTGSSVSRQEDSVIPETDRLVTCTGLWLQRSDEHFVCHGDSGKSFDKIARHCQGTPEALREPLDPAPTGTTCAPRSSGECRQSAGAARRGRARTPGWRARLLRRRRPGPRRGVEDGDPALHVGTGRRVEVRRDPRAWLTKRSCSRIPATGIRP